MRVTTGRDASAAAALAKLKVEHGVRTAAGETDVQGQSSIDTAAPLAFAHVGGPAGPTRAAEYDEPCTRLRGTMTEALGAPFPHGREAGEAAGEIVRSTGSHHGERPLRTPSIPPRDGSEADSAVYDGIRAEFFHRIGIDEPHTPRASP
ncbi:hypothetical protein ABZV75_25615 [Streptomyces flaveolus]|uniref:hypothetical protein n=1 Tax=Streptomyces flaveolus TaxID=67297 RepID=UPI0033B706CB